MTTSSASATVWYVNDTSTTGDSFTSAIGFDTNNGLTPATPKRNITAVTPLLSAGDTIFIDAGTFDSIVTVSATETAAIRIDTDNIFVIGKDSKSTIIDPIGLKTLTTLYAIYADTQTGLVIKNLAVTGAYEGIYWRNVNQSTISSDSASSCGDGGIYLRDGSDTNTLINITANSNFGAGINLSWSSYNNVVSNNLTYANSSYGILLVSSSNNTLSNNTADSNNVYGIYLTTTANSNSVSNNTANLNASSGIYLVASSNNNIISNNTVRSNLIHGIYLSSSSNNAVMQNTVDSNAKYQIYIDGTSLSDTVQKNNVKTSPINPDSKVFNGTSPLATLSFIRNSWNTTDSGTIRNGIWGPGRDSITYHRFRLGIVDTAPLADTVAPKAPDTVMATVLDSTRITISWAVVSTSEEVETTVGLLGYRVYRALTVDSTFWQLRGTTAAQSYVDSGLTFGQGFYYRVTSFDNHSPFENQSFYSDSIAYESTSLMVSVIGIATPPAASPISRTGPDSVVIAFTLRGANPDTVNGIVVRLAGNMPSTDVDTLSLYRDGNKNGRYEVGQDTLISILNFSSVDTFNATGLTAGLSGADSFIVTISLEDTANFADTFIASIPANGLVTSNVGTGPGSPFSSAGTWTVNSGVDTTGQNAWYVNDSSTINDSFTSAIGNDANSGLSPATPKRNITAVTPLLSAGDTIFIDAGTFDSIVTVSATESAGIRIDTNSISVIGVDSSKTIIDPIGANSTNGLYGIYANTRTGLTIRNVAVTGAYEGIYFVNVDLSTITGDSCGSNGDSGIYLVNGSDTNTVSNNTANSNASGGVYLISSSYNTVSNNIVNSNVYGIVLRTSLNNKVSDNTVNSNTTGNIQLNSSANNNTVSGNTVNSSINGILLKLTSNNNTVSGNTANSNSVCGMSCDASSNNLLSHNTANLNTISGIIITGLANNNIVNGNTLDSNSQYQLYIDGAASSDTFQKNNMKTSPTNPDSFVYNNGTAIKFDFARNWWNTTDSNTIRRGIAPITARDAVAYHPFRLGIIDTAPLADTVAPKAPDTVTATTIDSTRIMISWASVSASEEAETMVGLNAYRVYRAPTRDSTFWELRGQVGNATTTYTDSGLSVGQAFHYRVTSADNHTPFENQSFYSDSIASAFTMSNGVLLIGNGYDSTSEAIFFETGTTAIVLFYAPGETIRVQIGATDVSTLATNNGSGSDTVQTGFGLVSGSNTVTITRTNPLGASQQFTRTVVSDSTAPNIYFVTIDTGAVVSANDTIAVTFSVTGTPASYRLQGDITEASAIFIGYSGAETFSIIAHMTSGDAIKTVSISVKDSAGNISTALSDTITRNSTLGTTIAPTFTSATGDTTAVIQPVANDQVSETVTILQGTSDTIVVVLGDAKNDTMTVKFDFSDALKQNLIVCARIDTASYATTGESIGRISNYAIGSNTIREILVRDSQNRDIGADTKTFNSCRIIWNLDASLGAIKSTLEVFYFDTVTRKWLLARTDSRVIDSTRKDSFVNYATGDTLSILVRHFTIFGVFPTPLSNFPAQGNVANITVYPNPYVPYDGNLSNGEKGTATEGIRIGNLSGNDKIEIYDIRGRLVDELIVNGTGLAIWNAQNQDKQEVATGVYLIVVKGIGGIVTRKVAVVR